MFENLLNESVKVVWRDLNAEGENKALYGKLKDISEDFILILQNDSPVYVNVSSIITIKKFIKNENKQRT